jgi:hypothetical protein
MPYKLLNYLAMALIAAFLLDYYIQVTREPFTPYPDDEPVRCDAGDEAAPDVPLTAEPVLAEYPLPPAFEAWIERNLK